MDVRDRVNAAIAAMQARDARASCAHFTIDATYREARREPIVGRLAIEEHFAAFFTSGIGFAFHVDAVLVEEPVAVVVYRFAMERKSATAGSDFLRDERRGCAVVTVRHDGIANWHEYEG